MTIRDVIVGLVGVLIGALAYHWLGVIRKKFNAAAKRKADMLAFLYKLFAQMAAIPTSEHGPPPQAELIFHKALPQYKEHVDKIKGDFEGNAKFEEVINECGLSEEDLCQPAEVLRTHLLAKVQAVAVFLEGGKK
jgi:hypothetical protein